MKERAAKVFRILALSIAALFLSGCFGGRSVVYGDLIQATKTCPPPGDQITLFVDREGDLYPPSQVVVKSDKMTEDLGGTDDLALLEPYFRNSEDPEVWSSMLRAVDLQPSGDFQKDWVEVQTRLRRQASADILKLIQRPEQPRIVVLIHGYNNDYWEAATWYDRVSCDIRARDEKTVFLRIHWDGRKEDLPITIWSDAQRNGPLTGVGLRAVFRDVVAENPQRDIAVITHSTGALVAAALLGDSSAPFMKSEDADFLRRLRDTHSVPDPQRFRLGFLIPAAAVNTFGNYASGATSNAERRQRRPDRIVLGLNDDDAPTNKYIATCKASGDTCMNTRASKACLRIRDAFGDESVFDYLRIYEFSNSSQQEGRTLLFWEQHGVEAQMLRDRWDGFIEALLGDGTPPADDASRFCPRPGA
jgi:hypothetical protein